MIFVDPNLPVEKQRQMYNGVLQTMSALLDSPAWQAYDRYLESEEQRAFGDLNKVATGDLAMKAIGAYTAIKAARSLPHRSLQAAKEGLELLKVEK